MKDDIVNRVISSSGCVLSIPNHDKLLKYLKLLASAGKSEEKLFRLGSAYLKEALEPDPRTHFAKTPTLKSVTALACWNKKTAL
jgi:hypothetical protein